MDDLTRFEQDLARRLDEEARRSFPTFDAGQIAAAAITMRSPLDRLANAAGIGLALPVRPMRRIAFVALVAMLVLASVALAIGVLRSGNPSLVYIRSNGDVVGDVVTASADGSNARVIGHVDWDPLRTVVSLAPDGGHLATFGADWTLTILDANGHVTFNRKLDDRSSRWAWSRDGAHLAVLDGPWVHDETFGSTVVDPHLFIVSADGKLEGSTELPAEFRYEIGQGGIAWAPDGSRLALAGFNGGTTHAGNASSIWIVDVATLATREIVPPGSLTYDVDPVWLPDGKVLYSRLNGGIWQLDADTEVASQVFTPQCPCSGATIVPFVPSPDGTRLALIAPNVGLAVLDRTSGALTEIHLPDGLGGSLPIGWTPDGTALTSFVAPISDQPFYADDLAVIDIDTGQATVIAPNILAYDLRER